MWNRIFLTSLLSLALVFGAANLAFAKNSKIDEDLVYHSNLGKAERVAQILAAGANPNAKSEDGWAAISLAASRNDKESNQIVQHLVRAGADMNVRDPKGETPIMNAITNNNMELVKLLIDSGGDFRAVNTRGRSVLSFAEYFGNKDIILLINDTIAKDDEALREGKSRRRFYRILDDFIFFNCVQQYVTYNEQTQLYKGEQQLEKAKKMSILANDKVINSRVELEHNFLLPTAHATSIAQNTQQMMFNELEALVTTRNRRTLGVGNEADVDKRCTSILATWRNSFAGYETDKSRAEAQQKQVTAPVEEEAKAVFKPSDLKIDTPKPVETGPSVSAPPPAMLPDSLKVPMP